MVILDTTGSESTTTTLINTTEAEKVVQASSTKTSSLPVAERYLHVSSDDTAAVAVNERMDTIEERSTQATSDDNHELNILEQYGFGSGMRMYVKSLEEVKKNESLSSSTGISGKHGSSPRFNNIPKPTTAKKNILGSISKSFSGLNKGITRTLSNISKSEQVDANSTIGSNMNSNDAPCSITESPSNASKAASVGKSNTNGGSVESAPTLSLVEPHGIIVTGNDEVSSVAPAPLTKQGSTVSRTSSFVGALFKSPSLVPVTQSIINKAPSMEKVRSNISVSSSNSKLTPRDPSGTKISSTMGEALSNIAVETETDAGVDLIEPEQQGTGIVSSEVREDIVLEPNNDTNDVAGQDNLSVVAVCEEEELIRTYNTLAVVVPAKEAIETPENRDDGVDNKANEEVAVHNTANERISNALVSAADRVYLNNQEIYILEGKHVGIVPGLEDEEFCGTVENAMEHVFSKADELANAGTENLLPFDDAEEMEPRTPATRYFHEEEEQPFCGMESTCVQWFSKADDMANAGPENLLPFDVAEEQKPETPASKLWFW